MRKLPVLLMLLGVSLAALVVWWADPASVLDAVLRVGWGGFAVLALWQAGLFLVLGGAWWAVAPVAPLPVLVWGRMVRDAATTCLPFSPLGGYVLGARAVALAGLAWPLAAASTVLDAAAEILAQAVFSVLGVVALALRQPGTPLVLPLLAMLAAAVAAWAAFRTRARGMAPLQRLLDAIAVRFGGAWPARMDSVRGDLAQLAARPGRFGVGAAIHLLGWGLTGTGTWVAYRLLDVEMGLMDAIALDALLHALISAAFVIPGAAGVQEAGYAGLGALFGAPPEASLAVSVLRRARDAALGVPILIGWQWAEWRAARRRARTG